MALQRSREVPAKVTHKLTALLSPGATFSVGSTFAQGPSGLPSPQGLTGAVQGAGLLPDLAGHFRGPLVLLHVLVVLGQCVEEVGHVAGPPA